MRLRRLNVERRHRGHIAGVVGCWLLVVGCWLLVVGCWKMPSTGSPVNPFHISHLTFRFAAVHLALLGSPPGQVTFPCLYFIPHTSYFIPSFRILRRPG